MGLIKGSDDEPKINGAIVGSKSDGWHRGQHLGIFNIIAKIYVSIHFNHTLFLQPCFPMTQVKFPQSGLGAAAACFVTMSSSTKMKNFFGNVPAFVWLIEKI